MLRKSTLLAGLLVAGATRAEPLELNPNAQFDADVVGVALVAAPSGGVLLWSPLDLSGRLGSGTLRVAGPAGAYVLHRCASTPPLPFVDYAYSLTVKLRSLGGTPAARAEVVLMWGGDDGGSDGPCRRPTIATAAASAFPDPEAELEARVPRAFLVADAAQQIVLHKVDDADVLVDAWSLTIDADPLTADGFESFAAIIHATRP
jgi:hypothetical protein